MSRERHSTAFIRSRQRSARLRNGHVAQCNGHIPEDQLLGASDEDAPIDNKSTLGGPRLLRHVLAHEGRLMLALIGFRLANAVLLQTQFVPDESWQSVEVAHKLAFGYGHQTWEWRVAIRSSLYPMLFAAWFKFLAITGLDYRVLVVRSPRMWQSLLAAAADFHLYKFSKRVSGQRTAHWVLFLQLSSWFTLYCGTRTLTNSVEWALSCVALAYYPWPEPAGRRAHWKFCLVVAVASLLRPTAAVQWAPLVIWHLWRYRLRWRHLLAMYVLVGLFTGGLSLLADKHFYGRWTLTQWNFLAFNVLADVASMYGVHPWHWYFSQGLPILFGSHLPLVLLGGYRFGWGRSVERALLGVILWTAYLFSFLAHKEFRFLFPLLPLGLHLGALALEQGFHGRRARGLVLAALLATSVPTALYTSLLHQRGVLDAVNWLGAEADRLPRGHLSERAMRVLLLTPCHATPLYSHVHRNVSMRFLRCEPNLDELPGYREEQEVFFERPAAWLRAQYPAAVARHRLPTHVLLFEGVEEQVKQVLFGWRLKPCRRFFQAHVTQGRQSRYLIAYCALAGHGG